MAPRAIGKREKGAAPSLVPVAAVMLGVSVMAMGGGYFVGSSLFNAQFSSLQPKEAATSKQDHGGVSASTRHLIGPIVANLRAPDRVYVRVEGIVFMLSPLPGDEILAEHLADDILQHLRSTTLQELQGVSGMQNLRADLNELVSLRFKSRAKEFLFRGFGIE